MVAQSIESLKHEYTDKYVVVDASRPELARFRDVVGQVKTVNMSGRALVEFLDYHLNIGWYDIAPEFLKIVDKPLPKEEKPAAKKEAKPTAAKAAPAAKPEAAVKPQVAAKPAAGAAKPGRLSVAEMLAAARGKTAPAASAPAKAEATAPVAEAPVKEKPKAEAPAPAAKSPAAASEKVDRSKMSVAEMIAWCRAHDAK